MLPWKRYSLPEPCAAKAARTVLRGRGDSNVVLLPGGRVVIKVNPRYTSQDCSRCGQRMRKTLAMRKHRCENCGLEAHRDHNAAMNIKGRAGLTGMVPDGESREP